MAVKLSDLIKQYEGSGSGDFTEWSDKLELVAKLQKINDLHDFVPLFLSGAAFAVYQQLSEDVKKDYGLLKAELVQAFGVNCFTAYESLQSRKYVDGETVDVYMADLRRLVTLVGQPNPESMLKCAFVSGLPVEVAIQLKSIVAIEKLNLDEIVTRARMILSTQSDTIPCAVGALKQNKTVQCYKCSGLGHIARFCPKLDVKTEGNSRNRIVCYACNKSGHIARNCPERAGNEGRSALAPGALLSQPQ